MNNSTQSPSHNAAADTKTIGSREYVVKSVFLGGKDIKTTILKLAERKTIREMGLDVPVEIVKTNTL